MIGSRVGIYSGKNNFVGILDLLNSDPYYAYSIRRLKSTITPTTALIRLRRSSDDAEKDFCYNPATSVIDGSSPDTDNTTTLTTWKGADSLFVVTRYDQSGNARHETQGTKTNQPAFLLATFQSTFACLNFTGNTKLEFTGKTFTDLAVCGVGQKNGTTFRWYLVSDATASSTKRIAQIENTNSIINYGTSFKTYSTGHLTSPTIFSFQVSGSTGTVYYNTSSIAAALSSYSGILLNANGTMGAGGDSGYYEPENILTENISDLATIRTNQSAYYGISI